jgi:hypothetical protein
MIIIFHFPSRMRKARSMPLAAISGVTSSGLPVGEYPTFLSVLVMLAQTNTSRRTQQRTWRFLASPRAASITGSEYVIDGETVPTG